MSAFVASSAGAARRGAGPEHAPTIQRRAAILSAVPPARSGNDEFAAAVTEYHRDLARFASSLCGDATLAEDAVAEAYARVWPKWRRNRIDNLFGYLRRTVANEIYGKFRRRKLERREAVRPPDPTLDGQFETDVGDRNTVWPALAGLSNDLRVVQHYQPSTTPETEYPENHLKTAA